MATTLKAFTTGADRQAYQDSTLEALLRSALRHSAMELNVCLPAVVVATQGRFRADVQPLLQVRYTADKEAVPLPMVLGTPVSQPSGGAWHISAPVAPGDQGWLIFADRSLDQWLAGDGGQADPQDGRAHALTDAIFVPGLLSDSQATAKDDGTSDIIIHNGGAEIRVQQGGTVRLFNAAGHELVDLTIQLASAVTQLTNILAASQTITMLGPQPTLWAAAQAQLQQLQGSISQLTGYLQSLKGN